MCVYDRSQLVGGSQIRDGKSTDVMSCLSKGVSPGGVAGGGGDLPPPAGPHARETQRALKRVRKKGTPLISFCACSESTFCGWIAGKLAGSRARCGLTFWLARVASGERLIGRKTETETETETGQLAGWKKSSKRKGKYLDAAAAGGVAGGGDVVANRG